MKNILFFILLSFGLNAQTGGYMLQDASGFTATPILNTDAASFDGTGTSAAPLFAKNFWNANLSATGNRTHNAQKKSVTIQRLDYWSMAAGVLDPSTFLMDSVGIVADVTQQINLRADDGIYLRGGTSLNPKINLANNKIEFDATSGFYYFANLPTYANDAAAASGGLLQNALYKTSSGVLMIKL